MRDVADVAHGADVVIERLPSRAAQKRARLRACGRVRHQARLFRSVVRNPAPSGANPASRCNAAAR